jgi:hypothetical protein
MSLPGVGAKGADKILEMRQTKGDLELEDLSHVPYLRLTPTAVHSGNLQLFSDQLLCSKMALRNGLFPVRELGFTREWECGSFPCHGQTI